MAVTQIDFNNFQPNSGIFSPTISNIQVTNSSYTVLDDTAVSTSGGFIKITGTNFNTGVQVYIGTTLATSISLVNSTVLNVQVPATIAGSYDVTVVNTDGTYCIKPIGITFSPINITWVTSSSLGPYQTGVAISLQLNATGAAGYQLQSGSTLPTGLTLSTSGLLSGTVNVVSNTTYSFTIEAYDSELQDAPRTFSLSVVLVMPPSSVEYLVVAGGGGGGAGGAGGGGGAGGLRSGTGLSVTSGIAYTVTVGAGGTAATNGANSIFSTITSTGGGAGGSRPTTINPSVGGSGGGGYGDIVSSISGAAGNTPSTTPSQGNNGGNNLNSGVYGAGGGGGAGGVGQSATGSVSGAGGVGTASAITGASVTYAGGGGGGQSQNGASRGLGGTGGGGAGGTTGVGTAGGTNTGGGGGGGGGVSGTGGSGGSGVVIIRYSDSFGEAVSTTGSPTVTVAGGFRIYQFNSSGSITF